jgi:hypothetical protein
VRSKGGSPNGLTTFVSSFCDDFGGAPEEVDVLAVVKVVFRKCFHLVMKEESGMRGQSRLFMLKIACFVWYGNLTESARAVTT